MVWKLNDVKHEFYLHSIGTTKSNLGLILHTVENRWSWTTHLQGIQTGNNNLALNFHWVQIILDELRKSTHSVYIVKISLNMFYIQGKTNVA